MNLNPVDHSFHDAWVERVSFGPRQEFQLFLSLGSARMSDPELPEQAILRFGAVTNISEVQPSLDLGPDPICRIDQIEYTAVTSDKSYQARVELDPQGVVIVKCRKIGLTSWDGE